MIQAQYLPPKTIITRFSVERVGDNILLGEEYNHIKRMIHTRILEIKRLQDKTILEKLSTEELKNLKRLINEILKERK